MTETICIFGLGYVGLPLYEAFSDHYHVVGVDTDNEKVSCLTTQNFPNNSFATTNYIDASNCTVFFVTVPTPVDQYNIPDLTFLNFATSQISKILKPNDLIIFESTVHPGCTEEVCIPILEKSGLKVNVDFSVAYSPERINPGDTQHSLKSINKVLGATNEAALERAKILYSKILDAKLHTVNSLKVAEASKILENTQRDVNIALMNEFSIYCKSKDIDIFQVLEAAKTKWNFCNFHPGLVGGHCIGIDPYYLIGDSKKNGINTTLVQAARSVNEQYSSSIAIEIHKWWLEKGNKAPEQVQIGVLGCTFKPNIDDIRNSKVFDLIAHLRRYDFTVRLSDPLARDHDVKSLYNEELVQINELKKELDILILAVGHDEYLTLSEQDYVDFFKNKVFIYDMHKLIKQNFAHAQIEILSL